MRKPLYVLFGVLSLGAACGIAALDRQPKPIAVHPPDPHAWTARPDPSASPSGSSSAGDPNAEPPDVEPPDPPPGPPGTFKDDLDVSVFQKGNIHTHTRWSDGDSRPDDVIRWYRDHGYNFLAITDHNSRTNPGTFKALEKPGFVLIGGEEVTMVGHHKQVHENALCTKSTIGGGRFPTVVEALDWGTTQITAQHGVVLINHPNFDWALRASDVETQKNAKLLEIWSGHPYVHTDGDATHRSHEAIWDHALTRGLDFAGVAVDDAHHWKPVKDEAAAARSGRGWVQVFAPKADRKLICAALSEGKLYASSGVTLKRITVKGNAMSLVVDGDAKVEFIGWKGRVLATVKPDAEGLAKYELKGGEVYVRARVTTPEGKHAFTQAYRVSN